MGFILTPLINFLFKGTYILNILTIKINYLTYILI